MSVSLDQCSEILYSLFLLYVQVEEYENILKLRRWPLAFTTFKTLLKRKRRSGASLPVPLSTWFCKKNISHLYSINWPNFIVWLPLLLGILGNISVVIICFPVYDLINFEINLTFLIKSFSCMTKEVKTKIKIS